VNRGHSLTISAGDFSGIQIDLRGLREININPGGRTANFQAGVYGYEVLQYMGDRGYVTATGTCSCVSILGPALGGGHGNQQGKHGLTSDGIVSMNVILANGTAITVSNESYPDLWWAMRGAGHNFGIVTSFEANIYPDEKTYYYRTYVFKGDQLEPLFQRLNDFHGNGTLSTDWLGAWGVFTMDPSVSTTEAVIVWVFVYGGPEKDAVPLFAPFDSLDRISLIDGSIPYKEVNDVMGGGIDSPLCEGNRTHIIGTAGLQVYNITAERQIYDLFNAKAIEQPDLSGTRVLHEGYSVEGVLKFKSEDSAFPFRDDYLLMYFDAVPEAGSGLEEFARQWQLETIDLFNAGQPGRDPTAYVNYASGYESLQAMYGYEPWRLERLRSLKAKYDPQNSFAYYNPIIPRAET
jgi:FAD/FMN-containing dehydrogenase